MGVGWLGLKPGVAQEKIKDSDRCTFSAITAIWAMEVMLSLRWIISSVAEHKPLQEGQTTKTHLEVYSWNGREGDGQIPSKPRATGLSVLPRGSRKHTDPRFAGILTRKPKDHNQCESDSSTTGKSLDLLGKRSKVDHRWENYPLVCMNGSRNKELHLLKTMEESGSENPQPSSSLSLSLSTNLSTH